METFLFTSESVTEGHPDKLCDQVSDAVLDACLAQDPDSKVACQTCIMTNKVMVFGEITTKGNVDYRKIVRDTCCSIGYTSEDVGLDANNCEVLVDIKLHNPDVAQDVHGGLTECPEKIGASKECQVFGYATDETSEYMPLSYVIATKLAARLTEVRQNGTCPWLRPAGKTAATVEYADANGARVPVRVHTILIFTQHDETLTSDQIATDLKEHVIKPIIPEGLDAYTIFHFNASGNLDTYGLSGRNINIDAYGGWGPHCAGMFSGQDPSNVDRSGSYLARQAAKSIVDSKLARRVLLQVSYALGKPDPLCVVVDTYGTGNIRDKDIIRMVKENFDFRPGMIPVNLELKNGSSGRFRDTAAFGHFGRDANSSSNFTWEAVRALKRMDLTVPPKPYVGFSMHRLIPFAPVVRAAERLECLKGTLSTLKGLKIPLSAELLSLRTSLAIIKNRLWKSRHDLEHEMSKLKNRKPCYCVVNHEEEIRSAIDIFYKEGIREEINILISKKVPKEIAESFMSSSASNQDLKLLYEEG